RVARVDLDGSDLDTLDVPIEVVAPSSDRFVTWTLSPPCTVWGWITTDRTPPFTGVIAGAQLVSPGPWGASALCRAVDCAGAPKGAPNREGKYSFEIPSGQWRIAPLGD